MNLSVEQREQLGRVLAVMLGHPTDVLADRRVNAMTPPAEAINFHDDGSLALKALPRRRYRLTGDDVQVDDANDARTHLTQRFRYGDGQPVMPVSVEMRLGEWE